jgi:hypothetical protein
MAKSEPLPEVLRHPVLIAITALAKVAREGGDIEGPALFDALSERALAVGVRPLSSIFDTAAEFVGLPYCRELDIYCSWDTRDEARRRYGHLYRN